MTTTGELILAGVLVAGVVLYFKKRGGCGCGGAAHAPAAAAGTEDDGPENEGYSVGAALEGATLFARDAFAAAKGGCGCGK